MMKLKAMAKFALTGMAGVLLATATYAQNVSTDLPVVGVPEADGLGFQPPATELMRDLIWLDNLVLIMITCIVQVVPVRPTVSRAGYM